MPREYACRLKHGVTLRVVGQPEMPAIANFLATAAEHFKHHRDVLKFDSHPQTYVGNAVKNRQTLAVCQLESVGSPRLASALWVEAVANAFAIADAVADMSERLSAYRDSYREGELREVLDVVSEQDGQFRAFALLMQRALSER